MLQKCAPELSSVLSKLFNKCLSNRCFATCWKSPSVIPVFKNSGERSDPKNYRPISLLPVISKVFESIINSSLVNHLESLGLFSDHQYGFRSSRSTADLLTVITERIHRVLDISGEARAVALDISKAFDKVWHAGLLHKLKAYGISGSIFDLISSFLSDRRIRVVLDGHSSTEYTVNSGVPRGSVFLIFGCICFARLNHLYGPSHPEFTFVSGIWMTWTIIQSRLSRPALRQDDKDETDKKDDMDHNFFISFAF